MYLKRKLRTCRMNCAQLLSCLTMWSILIDYNVFVYNLGACLTFECLCTIHLDSGVKNLNFFEKIISFQFFDFFSKGGTHWCRNVNSFFRFFIFFNFFLKNGLNGTYKMINETKSWNMSSFGASSKESWGITYMCRHKVPPPCIIGLRVKSKSDHSKRCKEGIFDIIYNQTEDIVLI